MSAIDILRDALFGNPPTPGKNPSRQGVLDAFTALSEDTATAISRAGLGALVSDAKPTAAELSLALKDKSVALVFADPDDANNDLWLKTGASGAGSWTNTGALHSIIDGLGAPYVDGAEQSATDAAASEANASASEQAAAQSVLTAQEIAASLAQYAIPGPLVPAQWRPFRQFPKLIMTGTGTVSFEARDSTATILPVVQPPYTLANEQNVIRYPYFGDNAVEIRAIFPSTLYVEIF